MDYDESAIARIYDDARALTPERLRQWRDVLAMDIDCSRISAIVDLGCGTGRFTQLLAAHFQAEVIGIDPSRRMIERARRSPLPGMSYSGEPPPRRYRSSDGLRVVSGPSPAPVRATRLRRKRLLPRSGP